MPETNGGMRDDIKGSGAQKGEEVLHETKHAVGMMGV